MNGIPHILILLRNPNKKFGNIWEFPKGKVKENESFLEALEREVFEEIGFKFNSSEYKKIFVGSIPLSNSYTLNIYTIFITEDFKIKLSEEHVEYRWVNLDNLNKVNIDKRLLPIIKEILEDKGNLYKCLR